MRILLISHDALQTGAPILLLNLASVLKESRNYQISFLLKNDGDLKKRFYDLAPVELATEYSKAERLLNKIPGSRFIGRSKFSRASINRALKGVDLIISNTITNGALLVAIREKFKGPIISYIHELQMAADYFTSQNDLQNVLKISDRFIVPSESVRQFLIEKHGVASDKIDALSYFIPQYQTSSLQQKASSSDNEQFIVGCAGTIDWRKAPDLFIAIAKSVFEMRPEAKIIFLWKGAKFNSLEFQRLNYDLGNSKIKDKVIFLESSSEMGSFFRQLNLFVLTSREDPYPLVVLEAASLGVPSLCFKRAGGAEEFIQEDAGSCVEYMSILSMAEKILFYYDNRSELAGAGKKAKEKMKVKHQRAEEILDQFDRIIEKMSSSKQS